MSKAKTRRAGSVTPLGDGRFWARLTIKGKRESLGVHASEDVAQAAIDAAIRQAHAAASGGVATSSGLTLGEYAKTVLDRRELAKFRAVERERYNWNCHLAKHPISERLVVDIRPADVWRLYREMASKKSERARPSVASITDSVRSPLSGLALKSTPEDSLCIICCTTTASAA